MSRLATGAAIIPVTTLAMRALPPPVQPGHTSERLSLPEAWYSTRSDVEGRHEPPLHRFDIPRNSRPRLTLVPTVERVHWGQVRCHLGAIQTGEDRSRLGMTGRDRSSEVRDLPRNRERVTGVEPATLCLASAATPVTSPSDPIAREDSRGFSDPVVWCDGFRWHPIRYNAGTTPGYPVVDDGRVGLRPRLRLRR
jgi:hypothetical protein